MKNFFDILKKCPLFQDISDEGLLAILSCLGAKTTYYKKGDAILSEGMPAKYVGIILSGGAQIIRGDYYGNRSIVANIGTAQIFGESFACAKIEIMPVSVIVTTDTEAMLIDAGKIIKTCFNTCDSHNQLIFNLLKIMADKNLVFHQKIEITSKRTTRDKLMAYLLCQAKENNSNSFTIPYDRQELADYLEVERSGLSAQISKLRKEGVLESRKNYFKLLRTDF